MLKALYEFVWKSIKSTEIVKKCVLNKTQFITAKLLNNYFNINNFPIIFNSTSLQLFLTQAVN